MKRIGEIVFAAAFAVALALYWLTAPDGLPWNASTHLALAYLGEIVRLPSMPHPFWGFYVQVCGGSVALSVVLAALAAGLLGSLVNRYFGWRFAAAAALVWVFLPGVWNRAITGERGICLAAMLIVAAWTLNAVALRVLKKARAARRSAPTVAGGNVVSAGESKKSGKVNRIAGWVALGAAGVFAVVSLTLHDYRYGEAASVFARGVVNAAGERCIVLSGVCDDQVVDAAAYRVRKDGSTTSLTRQAAASTIALRNDDAYRTNLVRLVRSAFPSDTNLWVAAQVSPQAFVDAVIMKFPDRFYLMNGTSTTLEAWERRWEAFKPHLESSDPFVREARRMFGYEGNAVANAMLEECEKVKRSGEGEQRNLASGAAEPLTSGEDAASPLSGQPSGEAASQPLNQDEPDAKRHVHCQPPPSTSTSSAAAWQLYKRIYTEVDPGNFSALLNMSEMIRRGYAVSGEEKKKVQEKLERFFKDSNNRKHMREIARAAGPVRSDPVLMEKMAAEAKKRIAAKIAAGEKLDVNPEILSLLEWNDEMCQCMDKGELAKAGRIARAILSNPKWRGFIPANAVMGSVASYEGDYVASERFFRVATDTTNKVVTADLNNYADTLMHLGKLDEAEKVARRAVNQSDEKFWLARLTLAEVLEKKGEKVKVGGQEGKIDEAALAAFAVGGEKKVEVEGRGRQRCQPQPPTSTSSQPPTSTSSDEISTLLKSVLKYAPERVREKIRREHKGYVR